MADEVFVDPTFNGAFFSVITQFAQIEDVGVALIVQMVRQSDKQPLDISGASSLQIFIGLPNGTRFTKTAQLYNDGLDGKMFYVTEDGDLPISDIYSIQGKVVIGSATLYSAQQNFSVLDNITPSANPPAPDPHVGTFTDSDLASGVLTIYHYEDLQAPYAITVNIFDNNGHQIVPDAIVGSANSVAVYLTSYAPISGTWGWVYQ